MPRKFNIVVITPLLVLLTWFPWSVQSIEAAHRYPLFQMSDRVESRIQESLQAFQEATLQGRQWETRGSPESQLVALMVNMVTETKLFSAPFLIHFDSH